MTSSAGRRAKWPVKVHLVSLFRAEDRLTLRVLRRNIFPFHSYMYMRIGSRNRIENLSVHYASRRLRTSSRTLELIDGQEES
jgi:hypothetical protein